MKRIFTILILLSTIAVKAQTNDFLISGKDSSPSVVIQNSPKLFWFNSEKFLSAWNDYREGEPSGYAQWFDSLGNTLGSNFKINGADDIIFNNENKFLSINDWYGTFFLELTYNIDAQLFQDTSETGSRFQVYSVMPAGFDIDPLGIDYKCLSTKDKFVFFIREDGFIITKAYDLNGYYLYEKRLWNEIPLRAGTIGCAANSNGDYLLASFNARDYSEQDSVNAFPLGIYVNIFNSDDSLMVKNILIKEFLPDVLSYDERSSPKLHCVSLNDSLWQIFWLDLKNRSLSYARIDQQGNMRDSIFSIVFTDNFPNIFLKSFSFSQIQNQQFSVFISTESIPQNEIKTYHQSIINFSSSGEYLNKSSRQVTSYSPLSFNINNIFRSSDSSFFCVSGDYKDIYLNHSSALIISDSTKINDDHSGSNEHSPTVTSIDEDKFFAAWSNEKGHYGVSVDKNGIADMTIREYEGTTFYFLPSGSYFNLWNFGHSGYTLYDKNHVVIRKDTLLTDQGAGSTGMLKLSDSLNILYHPQGSKIKLVVFNSQGNMVTEKLIDLGSKVGIRLWRVDDKMFLVNSIDKNQYYNADLESVSVIFSLNYDLYLGNKKFLQITGSIWEKLEASIVDSTGKKLKIFNLIKGYYNPENYKVYRLPESGFIFLYKDQNKINASSYSSEGIIKSKPFMIHDNTTGFRNTPSVAFNKEQAFFVWSDARDPLKGYDIYGKIINAGKLTEVTDERLNTPIHFKLMQNYPNPFNPVTTIKYSIPENSKVELRVFDVIGRQVAALVNDEKPAGEYTVNFDASHLSSGIYIYKITTGKFSYSRKMILLK